MSLNPQQHAAVTYLGGPLFVLAGAGSGKTRVITEKIVYMLKQGYPPQQIAAITFTNKAAREMRERLDAMLGNGQGKGLTVCTFHALGMRILRAEAEYVGYKAHFSVLDASDSMKILTELSGATGREAVLRSQQRISLWKNALLSPPQALQTAEDDWARQTAQLYAAYQHTLTAYQAVDFDDLICLPVQILREQDAARTRWQQRLRYLLVDECQDTNYCQYALMRLLAGIEGRFTAVGDDDQSIYAWRGADMENLRRLQQDYPTLKIIKLEQNYRSNARILRVANHLIAHNPKLFPKTLWSCLGEGAPVRIAACQNEQHEADYTVWQIRHLKAVHQAAWSDFAVLYRGNHQARLFEETLRAARIPYRLSGGQSFFDKSEIKDITAYLRLLANPEDDPAFLRAATTPKRGIGESTLDKLNQHARADGGSLFQAACQTAVQAAIHGKSRDALQSFVSLIDTYRRRAVQEEAGVVLNSLLADIAYESYIQESDTGRGSRWKNVCDLTDWLARKGREDGKNLIELSQTIALMTLLEGKDDAQADAVNLSTLHAAKGLEYPFVFLAGCEEGLFPHADSVEEGRLDEERRLMYVGITRAKQHLTLTHCLKRKRQGAWQFPEPSRFLDEMPAADVERTGRQTTPTTADKAEGRRQLGDILAMLDGKIDRNSPPQ